jgi:hypothetical protein
MPPSCSSDKLPDIFELIPLGPSFDGVDLLRDPIGKYSRRVARLSEDQLSVSFRGFYKRILNIFMDLRFLG